MDIIKPVVKAVVEIERQPKSMKKSVSETFGFLSSRYNTRIGSCLIAFASTGRKLLTGTVMEFNPVVYVGQSGN